MIFNSAVLKENWPRQKNLLEIEKYVRSPIITIFKVKLTKLISNKALTCYKNISFVSYVPDSNQVKLVNIKDGDQLYAVRQV